ncbi:MAG: hypothetical protein ACOC31_02505 [Bacteroidota bacterium]
MQVDSAGAAVCMSNCSTTGMLDPEPVEGSCSAGVVSTGSTNRGGRSLSVSKGAVITHILC